MPLAGLTPWALVRARVPDHGVFTVTTNSDPVVLVLDATMAISRTLAAGIVAREGFVPSFTVDPAEVIALVASRQVAALVVLPPVRNGDSFALVSAARRIWPELLGAIVLGEGRVDEAEPRVLWSTSEAVPLGLVKAVAGIASLYQPVDDLAWDETTSDFGDAGTDWAESLQPRH